jgi:hypothetical protein
MRGDREPRGHVHQNAVLATVGSVCSVGVIRGEDDEWDVDLKPPSQTPLAIGCLIVCAVIVALVLFGVLMLIGSIRGAGP